MVWLLIQTLLPKTRVWTWDTGEPLSGFGYAASTICAATWVLVLFAQGFHYAPITAHAGWPLILTTFVVVGVAIYDHERGRRP